MIKVNEKTIQALLLDYTMQSAAHRIALPNVTNRAYPRVTDWEVDLLSVNQSGFANEYEIKLSRADYLKDKLKIQKHVVLEGAYLVSRKYKDVKSHTNTPNYFWYVTYGFEIDPPPYAGWISIEKHERRDRDYLELNIKKRAPLLHAGKVEEERLIAIGRLLSYRLSHAYRSLHKYFERKENPLPADHALVKALCIQWRGDNFGEMGELDRNIFGPYGQENAHLIALTLNGREKVNIGDWVNKDNNGDLTVIKAA